MHAFSERDLESLYERELSEPFYERDLYEQGLYERDLNDQDLYERDLLDQRDLIARAIFERDPEAEVAYEQIADLAAAVQSNPHAGHAVYHALTTDPNVENVTEKLVADWVTGNNQK